MYINSWIIYIWGFSGSHRCGDIGLLQHPRRSPWKAYWALERAVRTLKPNCLLERAIGTWLLLIRACGWDLKSLLPIRARGRDLKALLLIRASGRDLKVLLLIKACFVDLEAQPRPARCPAAYYRACIRYLKAQLLIRACFRDLKALLLIRAWSNIKILYFITGRWIHI